MKYLLLLIFSVGCGMGQTKDTPHQEEKKDKDKTQIEERIVGSFSQMNGATDVDKVVLSLRCKQPAGLKYKFTSLQLKQSKFDIPPAGKGCQIEIKAIVIENTRFVQDPAETYSWETNSIVKLIASSNAQHYVFVRIERQLPQVVSQKAGANRFLFKVIETNRGDVVTRTTAGVPLISSVSGMALTTRLYILPTSQRTSLVTTPTWNYHLQAWNTLRVPVRRMEFSFTCAADLGYPRIIGGKLICGNEVYRDFHFVVVNGTIDINAALAEDICNTYRMTRLPMHSSVLNLPRTAMPMQISSSSNIILRSKYLDRNSGVFRQGCHVYPISPHLSALLNK